MLNGVSGMVGETAVVTKELAGPHQPGSVLARGEIRLTTGPPANRRLPADAL